MAYSERIKDFGRIRDQVRQFYVYGFKSREEYDKKSARSYDNERRRVESWLGDYVAERRESDGKRVYARCDDEDIDLAGWRDAIAFFSEAGTLGAVGASLGERAGGECGYLSFKHHYLLYALDSEVVEALLDAIRERHCVDLDVAALRTQQRRVHRVCPVRLYVSAQGGREYLLCYHYRFGRPMFFRLDSIVKAAAGPEEKDYEKFARWCGKLGENVWGVSSGGSEPRLDHVEMTVRVGRGEDYILRRLEREKRCGRVEDLGDGTVRFTADVADADELVPWLRTFLGRIVRLRCSNDAVVRRFAEDLGAMRALYGLEGGGDDALP